MLRLLRLLWLLLLLKWLVEQISILKQPLLELLLDHHLLLLLLEIHRLLSIVAEWKDWLLAWKLLTRRDGLIRKLSCQ